MHWIHAHLGYVALLLLFGLLIARFRMNRTQFILVLYAVGSTLFLAASLLQLYWSRR